MGAEFDGAEHRERERAIDATYAVSTTSARGLEVAVFVGADLDDEGSSLTGCGQPGHVPVACLGVGASRRPARPSTYASMNATA